MKHQKGKLAIEMNKLRKHEKINAYFNMGADIGDIMALLTEPVPAPPKSENHNIIVIMYDDEEMNLPKDEDRHHHKHHHFDKRHEHHVHNEPNHKPPRELDPATKK